jgi:hypothetical protein
VLWRKGNFGTQNAEGSSFVEAMMIVVASLKHQHRAVLTYLTAACAAAVYDEPILALQHMPTVLEQFSRPTA